MTPTRGPRDRKSTRLNSSHTEIYTLSLHDALPIFDPVTQATYVLVRRETYARLKSLLAMDDYDPDEGAARSEEHTSELQSHRDLHSFPTRRSSDLRSRDPGDVRSGSSRNLRAS